MAYIYETIIVGATPEGLELAKQLSGNGRKTVLVSNNFHKAPEIEGVEFLKADAVFLEYNHGLFGLSVMTTDKQKGVLYGTNIVIATGTKPVKSTLKNQNIRYKASDIIGRHKAEPAVVYGNDENAVIYALDLAKRFYYVYLCTKTFELNCNKRLLTKINNTANIVHLPGCNIMSCKNDKSGKLIEVTLDTYANIKSTALVMSLGRLPDLPSFTHRYIEVDQDGFVKTKDFNESTLVPGVYAIGTVCKKCTKHDIKKLADHLQAK